MTRRLRVGAAGAALLAVVLAFVVPAVLRPVEAAPAETPNPTDALIPLLDPLQPVLELISPIVYPACSNAVLVTVLTGALGVELPPEVSTVTGPLLVLCGSVPAPGTNERVCALDVQAQALLAELTKPLTGGGLPLEVAPLKWLTGLLDNVVDLIPVPGIPLGSTIAAVFQCVDPPPTSSTTLAPAPTEPGESPTTTVALDPGPSFVDPPTFEDLQTLPPVTPGAVLTPAVPVEAPALRLIDQPRFRYPVVMGLPLAFLALLAFFGRALTRSLGARDGGDR